MGKKFFGIKDWAVTFFLVSLQSGFIDLLKGRVVLDKTESSKCG